ncbi:MAG TPA: PLP-dependent aminotransferase family protein [Spirochaetia bacterium]|nr:PLP-dependent aminotransferase family protein [Spirochaetales bacterium]HRW23886.1 PLP-dependent aminotransferase family protein [Spirochaetia bacterium]
MPDFSHLYSINATHMKASTIRELLKLTQKPDIISFAGGLPAPDVFPVEDLRVAANAVFDGPARKALQYGTTEGDDGLRDEIIKFEAKQGVKIAKENLLVVSASQQALDIVAKLFLNPDDYVIAGRPTYLGALQAIQSYSAKVLGVPFTAAQDGFDMDELRRSYAEAKAAGKKLKYVYVIPDFQNPAGFCWSLEKRKALLEFAYETGLPILEDSPYREIRFMGQPIPSIYELDQKGANKGVVINLKTFSKILAPGTRIGWIMADPALIAKCVVAKQAMDLCTNVFTQMWLAEYMKTGKLYGVIDSTREKYRVKRNLMVEALRRYMPARDDLSWTEPEGGLFLWVTLPKSIDTEKLLLKAVEKKVAFVAGSGFYIDEPEHNSMRLNFSYSTHEQIEEGIKRLSEVVKEALAASGD